jgi:hypothetical protein
MLFHLVADTLRLAELSTLSYVSLYFLFDNMLANSSWLMSAAAVPILCASENSTLLAERA